LIKYMNKNFVLRSSSEADVPAIKIFLAPFIASNKILERTDEELENLFRNGFVAESEGKIVGCAAVEIYSRKLSELQCLAVAPEFQGQGIARELIKNCIRLAKENGVLELMMITSSEEIAVKCGFHYALPEQKRALFIRPCD